MELTEERPKMTYKYVFNDGYTVYEEYLGIERKEEIEQDHGKLIEKSGV